MINQNVKVRVRMAGCFKPVRGARRKKLKLFFRADGWVWSEFLLEPPEATNMEDVVFINYGEVTESHMTIMLKCHFVLIFFINDYHDA